MIRSLFAPVLVCIFLSAACGGDDKEASWEAIDIGSIGSLSGVWGSASDDVFVVGGTDDVGEVHHFDGTQWSPMNIPDVGLLVWSFGFGPDDVWCVGKQGVVMHYDGSSWTEMDSRTDQDLWGVWGASPNDVHMVGGNVFSGQITILHWDGQEISEEVLEDEANPLGVRALFKVFGVGGRVFAVGQTGLIVERTGDGWVRHSAGTDPQDFVALWGNSSDEIVAVGGRQSSKVSTFDGTNWSTTEPSQNFGGFNAVYVTGAGEILVGGVSGAVGIFDPETRDVEYQRSDTPIDIHAIWSAPDAEVSYAVGGTFFEPHRGVVMTLEND